MDFRNVFESNGEIQSYGENALLLFAMMLKFEEHDVNSFAADYLTDGNNDKKIDFLKYDKENGKVTIAQGYHSKDWNKSSAKSNKASDLNTAIGWLLSGDLQLMGGSDVLRPTALEIRDGLETNTIQMFEILFVHNLKQGKNVQDELQTCALNTSHVLKGLGYNIEVISDEVGSEKINQWFLSLERNILVEQEIKLNIKGHFLEEGKNWTAYVCSVGCNEIKKLYEKFGESLFSANLRGFLGTRGTTRNINHNISQTAENNSDMFWVYNNGITAITNGVKKINKKRILKLQGIAIINGAQTTGSLSKADINIDKEPNVMIRIIITKDQDEITNIVRYNNTQNIIYTWELRSGDKIQRRLNEEFKLLNINYVNRRSFKRNTGEIIAIPNAAQALIAFHGKPLTALKGKNEIFESDNNYSLVFNEHTTAKHICFIYSIIIAYDNFKMNIRNKELSDIIDTDKKKLQLISHPSFKQFLIFCCGYAIENIVSKKIDAKIKLHFRKTTSLNEMANNWAIIIEAIINSISGKYDLTEMHSILKSDERMIKIADEVRAFMDTISIINKDLSKNFSEKLSFG